MLAIQLTGFCKLVELVSYGMVDIHGWLNTFPSLKLFLNITPDMSYLLILEFGRWRGKAADLWKVGLVSWTLLTFVRVVSNVLRSKEEKVWKENPQPGPKQQQERLWASCSCIWQNQSGSSALGTRNSLTALPPYGFWAYFPLAIWCPFAIQMATAYYWPLHKGFFLHVVTPWEEHPFQGRWRDEVNIVLLHLHPHPALCLMGQWLLCVCMCQSYWITGAPLGVHEPEPSRHLIWTFQAANQALCHVSQGPCVLCFDVVK